MKQDLTIKKVRIEDNSVVIKKYIKGIEGGRTLDVTDFSADVISAGHVIITDGNGNYKPMPIADNAYATLPTSWKYAGILYSSVLKEKAAAAIMTWGVVNEEALPFGIADIKSAFIAACPHIEFTKDEEA